MDQSGSDTFPFSFLWLEISHKAKSNCMTVEEYNLTLCPGRKGNNFAEKPASQPLPRKGHSARSYIKAFGCLDSETKCLLVSLRCLSVLKQRICLRSTVVL